MHEIEERLARHAASIESATPPLSEAEILERIRRPVPPRFARPLAVVAAVAALVLAIGLPAMFLFTGDRESVAPSTSLPAVTVPTIPMTVPGPSTTIAGGGTTVPAGTRVVRGAPQVAVHHDGSVLVAFFETVIGPGAGSVGFGDGRDFAGAPEATTIVFRVCADPACSRVAEEGRVPVRPWSETLAAGLAPDGSPRFAYWAWGAEFQDDGGTWFVECSDPACEVVTEGRLAGSTPSPVRVAFDTDPGAPVAVLMIGTPAEGEVTIGVLSVSRGYGQSASLGLPPSPNWPYPDLAIGPDNRPVVVTGWDASNASPGTARLLMLVCSDPSCAGETIQTTLASWSGLWYPTDVAGIVFGRAGDIRVPFAYWDKGCPRCFTPGDWAEPWTGEIRVGECAPPDCTDPAVEMAAEVPGLLGTIGAGVAPDDRTVVGWLECPEMVAGLSLEEACPVMHAVAAACDATSCEEIVDVPIGSPALSWLVGMAVAPDGTPVFHWVETGGVVHVAACDGPDCATITDQVIAP